MKYTNEEIDLVIKEIMMNNYGRTYVFKVYKLWKERPSMECYGISVSFRKSNFSLYFDEPKGNNYELSGRIFFITNFIQLIRDKKIQELLG
jgi:hypothetical protein